MTGGSGCRTLGGMRALLRDYGDAILALTLTALMQGELWLSADRADDQRLLAPIALGVGAVVLLRRRAPLAALAVAMLLNVAANAVATPGTDDPIFLVVTLLLLVYSVGAHARGIRAVAGAGLVAVAIAAALAQDSDPADLGSLVFFVVVIGIPWVAGKAIQARGDRERILVAERDERARAAVAEERLRIARELHDVVSHAMGVVLLQSRGARKVLETQPQRARKALDEIEATSSQALTEMRRLLGLLREQDEGVALAPAPSVARLGDLADSVRASGLRVDVVVEGDERELPSAVDLSAYRIVQEALTNVLRHAGPAATARILLRYEPDALELEVADDGTSAAQGDGSGQGLIGMRERVAVLGGELESGPRAGGGFAVRATLPL